MTNYKNIILKKEDGVATLTLNRPEKMNALNGETTRELIQATAEVWHDSSVRVVIITGAGRGFCSGAELGAADFQITDAGAALKMMETATELILNIRNMPKPVIASVNGAAAGGGCNLALCCDIIIASDKAKFIQPYANISAHPDFGAIYFLPRLVGLAKANELFFTGRAVDATEADRIGMISRVVPADQLETVTKDLARKIAKCSPLTIRVIKSSIIQAQTLDLVSALTVEATGQTITFVSEDFKEGMKAFIEKREPVFKGK